ncbi:MAG: ATP-binding protein [Terriglobales bacterium]
MTEGKQIEAALNECEKKFLNALRECPLAVTLTSAIDHRYIEVNDTFERMSGWSRDEIIGRTPFDIDIWVDPSQRVTFVKHLLAEGTVRNLDVRARLKNREVWIGVGYGALIEIKGETCILSLIADITDRTAAEEARQAEEALSRMGRTLIQAHDEERSELARELHDHVENLVLLSIDLDQLKQNLPKSVIATSQQIEEAVRRIENLVIDIQALSNRLHSSNLEYLGLARAAASLCKEITDQTKVEIDFASEGLPKELPQGVSLCLFHVLQEAVQNAAKYSGSQSVQVSLTWGPNELHLAVQDSGIGFGPRDALKARGIGFTLMKERLKMVAGELSIESQPGRGTTIYARVPLSPELFAQRRVE